MPDTIIARTNKQNTLIEQRKKTAAARYPQQFAAMVADWNSSSPDDRAWLMYSANYFLRTAGVRWAIDPLTIHRRVPETPALDLRTAFDQLKFVLLTHRHADHLDIDLLNALSQLPVQWVIPDFLLPDVQARVQLPADQIKIPRPLEPFDVHGLHILPFSGLHRDYSPGENGGRWHGVPAMGYLVEFNRKRWLFPGDTRSYRADLLPSMEAVDGLFAHVWLGRRSALLDPPPLLDDFCRFCVDLHPKQIALTHLEEFGRPAEDFWEDHHAQIIISQLRKIAPHIPAQAVFTGQQISLGK
jgi:phosphoribosyl 1,2-cyclic phosphodiesterase